MEYLHETNVVLNAWEGLPREAVQGGDLWPVTLLSQHQHDLQPIALSVSHINSGINAMSCQLQIRSVDAWLMALLTQHQHCQVNAA